MRHALARLAPLAIASLAPLAAARGGWHQDQRFGFKFQAP